MYSNFPDFLSQCKSYLDNHPETKRRLQPVVTILVFGLDVLIKKTEALGFWAKESVIIIEFLLVAPKATLDFWRKAYQSYKRRKTIKEFLDFFDSESEVLINKALDPNSEGESCEH